MAANLWLDDENSSHSQKDDDQDLFVFGYACKIFRNDDKALYVDKGRHLIPWMGDERLMIDRYDGRGHLYDLSRCDADNVEKTYLSEEEVKIEKLCEEERYLELNTDVAEKTVYEEEEWKRYQEALQTGYQAVGFSYEQPVPGQDIYHQDEHQAEEEKPFIPAPKLNIPDNLELPPTRKMNAVIEKTAKFIAVHGTQMEIVLKAKQALNSQFDFLDYNSSLNAYYKFMVKIIKSGKYIPKTETAELKTETSQDDQENHHHEHGYLHKSLTSVNVEPTKSVKVPVISMHDTPYGQLVKSIRKHHKEERQEPENNSQTSQPSPLPPYIPPQVADVKSPRCVPAPPGTEPVDLPRQHDEELHTDIQKQSKSKDTSPIVPPPPDIQPIIDRMAMYVAKNGSEFEMVVKSKNDARFQFLNDWHVHYRYYDFKKIMHQKDILKEKKEKEEAQAALMSKGVSFSIKTRTKEPESVAPLKKPLFDYDSSDDNEDSESDKDTSASSTPKAEHGNSAKMEAAEPSEVSVDLFEDVEDKKVAEGRLMNRLATAAREKLAQTSKEKQIQAERKRKAAMFISLLKGKNPPDEREKTAKVVFDYGHGRKILDSRSPNRNNNKSRSITPPLSFSKVRRSTSRSPSRKMFFHPGSRRSRTPLGNYKQSSRMSPKRRSRTPRVSPKRHRSPKHRSRSPRRKRSRSISRTSKDRSSRTSNDRSSRTSKDRLSRISKDRTSKDRSSRTSKDRLSRSSKSRQDGRSLQSIEKSGSRSSSVSKKIKPDLLLNDLTDPSKIVVKQEKVDPNLDKIMNSTSSGSTNSLVNSEKSCSDNGEKVKNYLSPEIDKCTNSESSELEKHDNSKDSQEANLVMANGCSENDKVVQSPEKGTEEETDDDVEIVEVPVERVEPDLLVDLTQFPDSDPETSKKSRRKRKSRSRSPRYRKRSRRSKSHSASRRKRSRSRKSRSPPPRKRKSRSRSPRRRRSRSLSCSKKSRHPQSKSSKKNKSCSRSRSPKRRKERSRSPKHRKSRSKTPTKKISRRHRSKSKSQHRKRSRSKTPKKKLSHSKSISPPKKRSRTPKQKKKKHKSPSRSPKLHKKKKNKDKDREKNKEASVFCKTMTEMKGSSVEKEAREERAIEEQIEKHTSELPTSNEDSQDIPDSEFINTIPPPNLLNKVRAMLKASRDALKTDEDTR